MSDFSQVFRVFLGVLAAYRFAHAFSIETGPWAMFHKVREWVINRFGYVSWQSEFMHCPLCQGFWLCGLFALLFFAGSLDFINILLVWWGMAGGMTVLHLVLYRDAK